MASCFLATLVGVASERGIRLNRAGVKAYCELDFRKPLGLGDNPIVRSVRLDLQIEADIDRSEIVKLVEEAKERCPAIYSLRTPIEPTLNLL
jgi:organic hydroperoxide reductase OsmC/OhrA